MNRDDLKELHYITTIRNVPPILSKGILSHKLAKKINHNSVAMEVIQERRKNKEPRPQGGALKPKFSKPKIEIPKRVRDDSMTGTEPSCHAELVSASGLLFSAFDRRTFHPRPQDGVFRYDLNKIVLILFFKLCKSPHRE